MKSRQSSPQTSPKVVRTFRVHSENGSEGAMGTCSTPAPRTVSLRIEELPTITAMNGFHPFGSLTPNRDVSPTSTLLGPLQQGVSKRAISGGGHTAAGTPLNTLARNSEIASSNPGTENGSPWSSAIGHATTTGKSGRVIERLMAENDKLKRDLELQLVRVQELERNAQTYRPQIDALKEKVESLSHASTMDSSLLSRRDRRIDELKADNDQLKEGKRCLERRLQDVEQVHEEEKEQNSRALHKMTESTKHATVHAEILETSHRQLAAEYRARRERWEHDLTGLQEQREADQGRLERIDVVCEQMRRESERTRRVQGEFAAKWEEYEVLMKGVWEDAEAENDRARKKSVEMEKVVEQMRWLMGVQRAAGDACGRSPDGLQQSSSD